MWSIKFLSGPQAGKEILLNEGLVILGRERSCEIPIPSEGVSKKHAQMLVKKENLHIEDLSSSNGTFFNGKQIQKQQLKNGDRVALSDIIFEVKKKPLFPGHYMHNSFPPPHTDPRPSDTKEQTVLTSKDTFFENIKKAIQNYTEKVVLPGVYKLAEWVEFRWVIGFFVIGFIFLVTVFSSVPLISILNSSIDEESKRNALTIATNLSQFNMTHIKKGSLHNITVDYALRRPGVETAYIISATDGRILAPANRVQSYPKLPLIHKARKVNRQTVENIGNSSVFAANPIRFYNPETGEYIPKAYAIIIYKKSLSLASGNKKVFALLAPNFLIACIVGLILFFFLIKFIEFPIKKVNMQLSLALKDEKSHLISVKYRSLILKELCDHINSTLNQISINRMLNAKESSAPEGTIIRQNEMSNLVEVIGFPALGISMEEKTVGALNSSFSDQIEVSDILYQALSEIQENDLRDHLFELLEQGQINPTEIAFGEISLKEMKFQTTCQMIMGEKEASYAIVTFMSQETDQEAA